MSVREVTYYEVVCDAEGCGRKTGDWGSDYTAWSDRSMAEDDWINGDGVAMKDGRTFCPGHIPTDYCSADPDEGHAWLDGEPECDCGASRPVGAGVQSVPPETQP